MPNPEFDSKYWGLCIDNVELYLTISEFGKTSRFAILRVVQIRIERKSDA